MVCRSLIALLVSVMTLSGVIAEEGVRPKTKPEIQAIAPKPTPVAGVKGATRTETAPAKLEPLTEATIKDRASYAIGLNFGTYLKQGIQQDRADVNMELLMKGVRDALTKSKAEYSDVELDAAIAAFKDSLDAKNTATSKATAEKNKKEGEAFLAKNKLQEGVQSFPSGLQYQVLKSGKGKTPGKTDVVQVHYHGMLPDGSPFDSSTQRGAAVEFPVDSVIKGWSEALLKMKVGDKWKLFVPPELAYGARRRSDLVGPNQVVVFEVELLGIAEAKKNDPLNNTKGESKSETKDFSK